LKPIVISSLTAALLAVPVGTLLLGCENSEPASPSTDSPAFVQVPATGNGHKQVIPIDEDLPSVDCGRGEILELHAKGWIQVRVFPEGSNHNVELDLFHYILKYTNAAGKTFTFLTVGPDHYYLDKNGNRIKASSGRLDVGLIGHIVTNLTTGEVQLVAGKEFAGGSDALACEALT
jgi:hypothetical protein